MSEERLKRIIREKIDAEERSGYARLRRVPSTWTWKVLDYVFTLQPKQRDALFDAFSANAVFLFCPDRLSALHAFESKHAEYCRMLAALPLMGDYKYWGVRMLRGVASDVRAKGAASVFANTPEDVIHQAEAHQPTTASEIRKVVKLVMREAFGAIAENAGGGCWEYRGHVEARSFLLSVDYGGRSDQLRYWVSYDDEALGLHARRLSYEAMMGMGAGGWNSLTAENLLDSVNLLREMVRELVAIPDVLSASGVGGKDG